MDKREYKKISIIVPVYNSEKVLRYCLESICNQTIRKDIIELILVNDASTDKSAEICREYTNHHDYIKLITLKKNGGQSRARNVGVKEAKGEYVFFADADDWLGRDCLERLLAYAENNNTDVVIGRVIAVDRAEKAGRVAWCRGKTREIIDESFEGNWDFYASMGPWGRLVKRKILTDNDIIFPEDMYIFEDIYWNMQIMHCASCVRIINNCDYYFLRRDTDVDSITTNERELSRSIMPENVYTSIDKLTNLSEEYAYPNNHPAWKRLFLVAVRDGIRFVSYAADIEPQRYPDRGRAFKDKIWERVKPHYSAWVRNNIGTDLLCRYDSMMAGYDFDYDEDSIRFFAKRKYKKTSAAEILENAGFTGNNMPAYLSKEARIRLAGEQAESFIFSGNYNEDTGSFSGMYFVSLDVSDEFTVEMELHSKSGDIPLSLNMQASIWGEPYQEIGIWTASTEWATIGEELEDGAKIEFAIKYREFEVYRGDIVPWDDNLGRPIAINPIREQLYAANDKLDDIEKKMMAIKAKKKKADTELKDLRTEMKELILKIDEMALEIDTKTIELKRSEAIIKKMKESYSWKITAPIRKMKQCLRRRR